MKKWVHGGLLLTILAFFMYETVKHHGEADGSCRREWQVNLPQEAQAKITDTNFILRK